MYIDIYIIKPKISYSTINSVTFYTNLLFKGKIVKIKDLNTMQPWYNYFILTLTFLKHTSFIKKKLNFEKFIESNKGLKGKRSKTEKKVCKKHSQLYI